jgi:hypothetical protein
MTGSTKPVIIRGIGEDRFFYIVMPMKLEEDEEDIDKTDSDSDDSQDKDTED